MRKNLYNGVLLAIARGIAAVSIAGCAAAPNMDGGIVGTGNRMNCEPQTNQDGTPVPLPEECKRQSGATR